MRSYYRKIAKVAQRCLLPASDGCGSRSQTPSGLRRLGSAPSQPPSPIENSWLRHWTAPSRTRGRKVEAGDYFADKEGDQVFVILCDVFYGWPLVHIFSSCAANSPVYKGVGKKISRREGMEKPRSRNCTNKPPSSLSVVVIGRTGHAIRAHLK